MKIGIAGYGFVGKATAHVLKEHHEIVIYDKFIKKYDDVSKLKTCDAVFICVPTPMKENGEVETQIIRNFLMDFGCYCAPEEKAPVMIIRSTAVPGTTRKFNDEFRYDFAFCPEFLREKYALEDAKNANRIVVGYKNENIVNIIEQIFHSAQPYASLKFCSYETAEFAKYSANVTLASQIAIANELYLICDKVGAKYDDVREIIQLDDRIGRNMDVPGPDGDFGFGGKCFPKDLNAFLYYAREQGYRPYLLEEVWRLNERVRKNRDWEKIKGATNKNLHG